MFNENDFVDPNEAAGKNKSRKKKTEKDVFDHEIINPVDLHSKDIQPRRWIVQDWVPYHYTTLLYADGGMGKTLFAMQLATAAATGGRLLGWHVEPVNVLCLFCEDLPSDLQERQAKINQATGCTFADLGNMKWISGIIEENSLYDFFGEERGASKFYEYLKKLALDSGAQLLILDGLADVFEGNEIQRREVKKFIKLLTKLGIEIDGAVVLLAHPSQSGMASGRGDSGSTQWNNACRSRLYLSMPPINEGQQEDPDLRVLSRVKANYAARSEARLIRWQDGVFVPVGSTGGGALDSIDRAARDKRAEEAFLKALDDFEQQGRRVSASPHSGNFAPKLAVQNPHCKGFRGQELRSAMERLFSAGAIKNAVYGKGKNLCEKITRIPPKEPGNGSL